jgi:hypothetical protein
MLFIYTRGFPCFSFTQFSGSILTPSSFLCYSSIIPSFFAVPYSSIVPLPPSFDAIFPLYPFSLFPCTLIFCCITFFISVPPSSLVSLSFFSLLFFLSTSSSVLYNSSLASLFVVCNYFFTVNSPFLIYSPSSLVVTPFFLSQARLSFSTLPPLSNSLLSSSHLLPF